MKLLSIASLIVLGITVTASAQKQDDPKDPKRSPYHVVVEIECMESGDIESGCAIDDDRDVAIQRAKDSACERLACDPDDCEITEVWDMDINEECFDEFETGRCGSLWVVKFTCRCRDGKLVPYRAGGRTYCEAWQRARRQCLRMANQNHGGACCCWYQILQRPVSCCRVCR